MKIFRSKSADDTFPLHLLCSERRVVKMQNIAGKHSTVVRVIAGNACALLLILAVAYSCNDWATQLIGNNQGGWAILTSGLAVWSFVIQLLYYRNEAVFLAVNKILMIFKKVHTRWKPFFAYTLSDVHCQEVTDRLESVQNELSRLPDAKLKWRKESSTLYRVELFDVFHFVLMIRELRIVLTFDRDETVPSHLYDRYSSRLASIAEVFQRELRPTEMQMSLTLTYRDGIKNPYFGYFVREVPSHLLTAFDITFEVGTEQKSRVCATVDSVEVHSDSIRCLFESAEHILSLSAIPQLSGK